MPSVTNRRGVVTLGLALFLAACGQSEQAGDGLSGNLQLSGSSTVAPLATAIGKRFASKHPGVEVDVQAGGSSRGIADARRGLVDIGTASRPLTADERSEGLVAHTIALDGIAIIVHADNPVAALTESEVVDIYTGEIQRWSAVGGRDAPITVVNKAEGRATLAMFLQYFGLDNQAIEPDAVIGHNEQGIKTVAGNANAIAYVSIGTAEYDAEHGTPIKLLPLDGVPATTDTLGGGDYPLARPLNVVTKGQPEGLAAAFIAYAQSSAVQDLVRDLYYVPAE